MSAGNKRPAGSLLGGLLSQSAKEAKRTASDRPSSSSSTSGSAQNQRSRNPFLSRPTQPEDAIKIFLVQARSTALRASADGGGGGEANFEIEARLGTLVSPHGMRDMRALSSGAKVVPVGGRDRVVHAFVTNVSDGGGPSSRQQNHQPGQPSTNFDGGITRSNYLRWTQSGLSEYSPLSAAFSCRRPNGPDESEGSVLRSQLTETETVTTVFSYPDRTRVNFAHRKGGGGGGGDGNDVVGPGHSERKEKLSTMDVALPAAPYDLRLTCATELSLDRVRPVVPDPSSLPPGWNTRRVKRRRSYVRSDGSFAWRMDVTEVATSGNNNAGSNSASSNAGRPPEVGYEIEMELSSAMTRKLLDPRTDDASARKLADTLAQQLWFMVQQLNPTHDVLEVSEFLREHVDAESTRIAIGQCGAMRKFADSGWTSWRTAIAPDAGGRVDGHDCHPPRNFVGSMPVNFSRHNIEEIQRCEGNGYFLSEKTDGVRYLMVFTGTSVVLVDRASHETRKAFQPKPKDDGGGGGDGGGDDPMRIAASAVKPGAVLDGEVVVHRRLRRPVFVVFDVLANSANEPILHLPFEQRLRHLRAASFMRGGGSGAVDVFDPAAVSDPKVALPLVRKNFVDRVDLDRLLSYVSEERGTRTYSYGDTHHHLTDGIIFQPNSPYVCGTDVNLLKWKYLDTVTIDVEILPPRPGYGRNNHAAADDDVLRVGVMGEEGTTVDMTRYLRLPNSERLRLEADRHETGSKIAEVGFDPTTGEWYYRTMRPDKVAPNHISTVLGTLLELAESLSTEELRYRMSVPSGTRDTYTRDARNMQKQLLDHQRRKNKAGVSK
ncbi:hypothetical protein ACHAW5_006494 [Stephanodiscus triporus]|uniref:mRNA 5'-phosphatase n=1 Tax=Stephanodiscus triporus TaxID=2934178 RepID=A0ABD3MDH6_9STRA